MRVTRGVQAVRNPKQSLISGGVAGYAVTHQKGDPRL